MQLYKLEVYKLALVAAQCIVQNCAHTQQVTAWLCNTNSHELIDVFKSTGTDLFSASLERSSSTICFISIADTQLGSRQYLALLLTMSQCDYLAWTEMTKT